MKRVLVEEFRILSVVLKRLLTRKSFWVILCLLPILLLAVEGLDRDEEIGLRAALYCEETDLLESLLESENPTFYLVETVEELKNHVLRGKAECGYVIPSDLFEAFTEDDWNWKVTVYEGPDSMFTELINEVLFEKIYAKVSVDWYVSYMEDKLNANLEETAQDVEETLLQVLSGGETFRVQTVRLQNGEIVNEDDTTKEGIISVKDVAAVMIYLMSLLAVTEALQDKEKGHFRKQRQFSAATWTVGIPVFIIGLASLPWIGLKAYFTMAFVTTVYGLILYLFVPKSRWMQGLIPVLFIAGLVCSPVFVDMESFFPIFAWIKWLFPLAFCL